MRHSGALCHLCRIGSKALRCEFPANQHARETCPNIATAKKEWEKMPISMKAWPCYRQSIKLEREHVIEGISCFPLVMDAIEDADKNIAKYTKSNFPEALFWERVKREAKILLEAV